MYDKEIHNIEQYILELSEIIKDNTDNRVKDVGDIVKIWDGSYNQDKHTGEIRNGINLLFESNAIVIEKDCKIFGGVKEFEKRLGFKEKNLDLLLKFPSGEEVYCKSSLVKRIDNYK